MWIIVLKWDHNPGRWFELDCRYKFLKKLCLRIV